LLDRSPIEDDALFPSKIRDVKLESRFFPTLVVPISARVSWLIFAIIGAGVSSLPKFVNSRSIRARRTFLTRIELLVDEIPLQRGWPNEHLGERWFLMDHLDVLRPHLV